MKITKFYKKGGKVNLQFFRHITEWIYYKFWKIMEDTTRQLSDKGCNNE